MLNSLENTKVTIIFVGLFSNVNLRPSVDMDKLKALHYKDTTTNHNFKCSTGREKIVLGITYDERGRYYSISHHGVCPHPVMKDWKCNADYKQCKNGTTYHCAKDSITGSFTDGCAFPVFCGRGKEPFIRFPEGVPQILCRFCGESYLNTANKSSDTYSRCSEKRRCRPFEQIECDAAEGDASHWTQRRCKCNWKMNFIPKDLTTRKVPHDFCLLTDDVTCTFYECEKTTDGKRQERLSDYSCVPACDPDSHRNNETRECVSINSATTTTVTVTVSVHATSVATPKINLSSNTSTTSLNSSSYTTPTHETSSSADPSEASKIKGINVSLMIVIIILPLVISVMGLIFCLRNKQRSYVPGIPKCVKCTHNSIEIEWAKEGIGETESCINSYKVEMREVDSLAITRSEQSDGNSCIFESLKPSTKYKFRVATLSNNKPGQFSEYSKEIQTEPPIPGIPKCVKCTHNSIEIKWNKEQMGETETCMDRYNVEMREVNNLESKRLEQSQSNSCIFDGLKPATKYMFCVAILNNNTSGEFSKYSEEIQTEPPIPGIPMCVKCTHNSIEIKWTKEGIGETDMFLDSYYVEMREVDNLEIKRLEQSQGNSFIFEGLKPATKYKFCVATLNNNKPGEFSNYSEEIQTEHPIPGIPKCVKCTHNSIEIKWAKERMGETETSFDGYTVEMTEVYNLESKRLEQSQDNSFIFEGLKPATKYKFCVATLNNNKPGEFSNYSEEIQTEPPIPGIPKLVKCTHNSIEIKWAKERMGETETSVDGYTVEMTEVYNLENKRLEQSQDNRFIFEGLKPATKYKFCVATLNKNKPGEFSKYSEEIQTEPPIPGVPMCVESTYNSIKIQWTRPTTRERNRDYRNNLTDRYTVEITKVNNNEKRKEECEGDSYEVNNLHPNTRYKFRVATYNKDRTWNYSEYSDEIQTPLPPIPGIPTCVEFTHNSIKIQWTKSTTPGEKMADGETNSFVDIYIVEITDIGTKMNRKEVCEGNTYEVTNLHPNTRYKFRVATYNSDRTVHFSEYSDEIETQLPPIPGIPTCVEFTHNSIKIQWTKSTTPGEKMADDNRNNFVDKYSVEITDINTKMNRKEVCEGNSYEVKNLHQYTRYKFRVATYNKGRTGHYSEYSDEIQTQLSPSYQEAKHEHNDAFNVVHRPISNDDKESHYVSIQENKMKNNKHITPRPVSNDV